jgi:hypothetical protein
VRYVPGKRKDHGDQRIRSQEKISAPEHYKFATNGKAKEHPIAVFPLWELGMERSGKSLHPVRRVCGLPEIE